MKGRHQGHADRLFNLKEHVDHPVLEDLKFRNRLAELFALLGIVHCLGVDLPGDTDGFRANGGGCFVDDLLNQRQGAAFGPDKCVAGDAGIVEGNFRGATAVDGRIIAG